MHRPIHECWTFTGTQRFKTHRCKKIDIEPTDTIERIKERVEEKEGIPPVQQRVLYAGKQLAVDKTAKNYNIEGCSVSLCKKIQSAVTKYWWDNNESSQKMAWVSWDKMAKPKAIGGLGFRDFQKFNDALLAKIGWRILHKPDSLLARVLMGKYCGDGNLLLAAPPSAASHGWRSVLRGRDLLLQNIGWAVGDGQSISAWYDPWLSLTSQVRPMGPPAEQSVELTVADLLMPDQTWDREKIQLLLPCAPKIKMFAWKLLKGALPVGARLLERHIDVDPRCKRCGCTESITHLFFHCRFAQKIWSLAPFASPLECSGMVDLATAWQSLCVKQCLPPAGVVWGSLFPWILWALWKARNRVVFAGFSAAPEDVLSSAIKLAREWCIYMKKEAPGDRIRYAPESCSPANTIVVRSDASWDSGRSIAGLGWVVMTPSQMVSFKASTNLVSSPLIAEGLALREAIRGCLQLEWKQLRFESDSQQLIRSITSGSPDSELYGVVSDILAAVSSFDFVRFAWIPRERNVIADRLAKEALFMPATLVVDEAVNASN